MPRMPVSSIEMDLKNALAQIEGLLRSDMDQAAFNYLRAMCQARLNVYKTYQDELDARDLEIAKLRDDA